VRATIPADGGPIRERRAVSADDDPSGADDVYTLGARLRAVRRQQGLSLQDVEIASNLEFRASVLGAYDRGERAITVTRLQRLARHYGVPVAVMVDDEDRAASTQSDRPLTIDLAALRRLEDDDAVLVGRYLRAIEVERGDYNGRGLTIRDNDALALASFLACRPEQVRARLDDLGIQLDR
jgi:transcriptional regulator with XRE-family HTH domain